MKSKMIIIVIVSIAFTITFYYKNKLSREVKIRDNEKEVKSWLNKIYTYQIGIQGNGIIDQDKDGIGEFAFLGELTGYIKLRSTNNYLPLEFLSIENFLSQKILLGAKSGYYFQIFLPHSKEAITCNFLHKGAPSVDQNSINAQEENFIVYAWPIKAGYTGKKCFAMSSPQRVSEWVGILESSNQLEDGTFVYSGDINSPKYNSAMPFYLSHKISTLKWVKVEKNKKGIDGQMWKASY